MFDVPAQVHGYMFFEITYFLEKGQRQSIKQPAEL